MSSGIQFDDLRGIRRRESVFTAVRIAGIVAAIALVWSTLQLQPWNQTTSATNYAAASNAVPWTRVNPIGVNTFLNREVELWKRERTLEMVSATGAGWIKQHFPWRDIETEQDVYWDGTFQQDAWSKYDAIVEGAERHGLRVIARIDLAPDWARTPGSGDTAPPRNYGDFADFVAEFVRHYRGRVQFIQIWNEPNLAAEWGGEIDPEGYAELLRVASEAAREADPNVVVLSAPMAMTTENSERAMDDLSYWQALYGAGVAPSFDIMAANAYGLSQRYDAAPDPGALNVRRIELLRELVVANGDGAKPIWLNEYGWNASPADFPIESLTWSRVTEEQQADWTSEGIAYLRGRHDWFGVANTWYFRQVGDIGESRSDYYFRMVDVAFTPRLPYWSVQRLGEELGVATHGDYNDLDAPIRPIGPWPIVRDDDALAGEYIEGLPGSSLSITVSGNSAVAVLRPQQQPTTVTIRAGDQDPAGREVDVDAGQSKLTLFNSSKDTAPRSAVIELEVSGDAPLLLDGVEVRDNRSYRLVAATGLALIGCFVAYFVLRRNASG